MANSKQSASKLHAFHYASKGEIDQIKNMRINVATD
jgi:hypothetical protein